jgi:lipid II isoglutaminyl synthase (glutamine-hydrolysing)
MRSDFSTDPVPGAASPWCPERVRNPRTVMAVLLGRLAGWASRRLRIGEGAVISGRVALAVDPRALSRLAAGRRVVLVSGTNGKTTTAHLIAAALRTRAEVAHNDTGANMPDGVVAALLAQPSARCAVLEVDELHLGRVAEAVRPAVVVLLNLTRDQLDRGSEVRAVAARISAALARRPEVLVVANADDPMVVGVGRGAARVVWVAAGSHWRADADSWAPAGCPGPVPTWTARADAVDGPGGTSALRLSLPGAFNMGNAALALAAADALGVPPDQAADALAGVTSIAGRYAVVRRGRQAVHLLLAKNPAGWTELLPLLADATALLLVVNARPADGRDTSWLWDVPFEQLPDRPTVASGERAADLGLRLGYAGRRHRTEPDPVRALDLLPDGEVYVAANYTAFTSLTRRLTREAAGEVVGADPPTAPTGRPACPSRTGEGEA